MAMGVDPGPEPYLHPAGKPAPTGPVMTRDEVARLFAFALDELSIVVEDGFLPDGLLPAGLGATRDQQLKYVALQRARFTGKLARVNELAKAWLAFEAWAAEQP